MISLDTSGLAFVADLLAQRLSAISFLEDDDERRGQRGGRGAIGFTRNASTLGQDELPVRRGGAGRGQLDARSGRADRASPAGMGPLTAGPAGTGRSGRAGSGSQAAVVKVASYAAGTRRVGALTDYLSREGTLSVETQAGQVLAGREAIAGEVERWTKDFENRAPSKDVASLEITGLDGSPEAVTAAFSNAFDGRKFAWHREHEGSGTISVVVVLAAKDRRRLDVSTAGRNALVVRLEAQGADASGQVSIALTSTGHGRDGLGYRLGRLVGKGEVHLSDGRSIETRTEASAVARDWASGLNSRRIRDTMHLILSAKAGTDLEAFRETARGFLGQQFEGHRYLFAIHRDRDHLHAHAVIAMRGDDGRKLDPKIVDFRKWREAFAGEARSHGIDMVATRRLERAAAPAYKLKDLNLIANAEAHGEPLPEKARQRVEAKQLDAIHVPSREEGRRAVSRARESATSSENSPDLERLEISEVASTFLADLKTLSEQITSKEGGMTARPIEDMQDDFKEMTKAATRIALLLPMASRGPFQALANPILDKAAEMIGQAVASTAASGVVSKAREVATTEQREARDAREVADAARRAAEPLRRNETPGRGERQQAEALARSAGRNAARESEEVRIAAEAARGIAVAPHDPHTPETNEPESVRKLREEQARIVAQRQKERQGDKDAAKERGAEDEM